MITFPSPSEFECLSFSSLCAAIKSRAFDPLTQLVYPEPWHPMRNRFNLIGIKGYLCRLPPSTALSRIARRRTPPFSHERKDKGNTTLLSKISTRDQERAYSMEDFFFFFQDRLRSPSRYQCRRNRSWNTLVYHEPMPFTAFSRNDKCYTNETDLIDVTAAKSANETNLTGPSTPATSYIFDIPNSWTRIRISIVFRVYIALDRGQIARVLLFRELRVT